MSKAYKMPTAYQTIVHTLEWAAAMAVAGVVLYGLRYLGLDLEPQFRDIFTLLLGGFLKYLRAGTSRLPDYVNE